MSDQLSQDLKSLTIPREVNPETRGRTTRVLIVLAVLAVLAAVGWFYVYPYITSRLWKTQVVATEISLLSPSQGSTELSSTGYVVAQVTAKVGAQLSSRITKVHVHEGSVVKAGDPIVDLDVAMNASAINSASSRVNAARARVGTAQAQLEEAKVQLVRERALVDRGVGTKATVEDLEARVRSLGEQVKAAEAEVRASATDVASRRVELQYGRVVAPIDGTIVGKPAQVGEVVSPTLNVIAEMADFNSMLVETDVPESRLGLVKVPGPCEIVLDAFPDRRYPGETVEVSKRIDRAKAAVTVKVKFAEPMADVIKGGVIPDMAARVSFLTEALDPEALKAKPKPVVPREAVVDRDGQKVVFVIEDGVVRQVQVVLGPELGGGFEVKAGPPPGTRIVSAPSAKLKSGQKVKEKSE